MNINVIPVGFGDDAPIGAIDPPKPESLIGVASLGRSVKVLTIKQPWASLIVSGHKNIENRNWKTDYRGDLLIHAGKSIDKEGYRLARSLDIEIPEDLPSGVILGKVNLVDCVLDSNSPWFVGKYGWVLQDPMAIDVPIPCKGKLGLWEFEVTSDFEPAEPLVLDKPRSIPEPLILDPEPIPLSLPLQTTIFGSSEPVVATAKGRKLDKRDTLWIPGLLA